MPDKLALDRDNVIPYRETHMTSEDQDVLIGRAVRRLAELAAGDDVLRAGLEALARTILGLEDTSQAIATEEVEAAVEAEVEAVEAVPASALADAPESTAIEPDAEGAPTRGPRTDEAVEPMNRAAFMKLIEEVAVQAEASALGSVAASLRDAVGMPAIQAANAVEPDAAPAAGPQAPTQAERDAVLPGIAERTSLKADLARAVAERARTGEPIDDQLVHRARSAHCTLWPLDVVDPDPDVITGVASCFAAVSDATTLLVLLREHDPDDHDRFAGAVRGLAAVQSALRIAVSRVRRAPDEDQVAAFGWLKDTTSAERIFVERHMRLDDPLDPDDLPDALAPICTELETVREQIERRSSARSCASRAFGR
ncbi:MAG TPA: hypothetical protein VFH17_04305 [Coriobacteriia bacterium]|nr:hypothetical protein [Coriobacteriia bacterium]